MYTVGALVCILMLGLVISPVFGSGLYIDDDDLFFSFSPSVAICCYFPLMFFTIKKSKKHDEFTCIILTNYVFMYWAIPVMFMMLI